MKKFLPILLLLLIPALVMGREEKRVWKSKEGKPIMSAILDTTAKDEEGFITLINQGQKWKVPLKSLSQEDVDYVNKVRGENTDIKDGIIRDKNKDENDLRNEDQYVLLIGVNNYANESFEKLNFSEADMKLLAECFEENGVPKDHIYMLTDNSPEDFRPTLENIRNKVKEILEVREPEHQMTIAYSGHGITIGEEQFLCPSDADRSNIETLIPRKWMFEQLDKCPAKQKLFIIDACREQVAVSGTKVYNYTKAVTPQKESGTHKFFLISSCQPNQKSWEDQDLGQGVFTYFIARGLRGAAKEAFDENNISVTGLFNYAHKKTKKYVKETFSEEQEPELPIRSEEFTNFDIAKNVKGNPDNEEITITYENTTPAGKREVRFSNGVEYAFHWCPSGKFHMGSSKKNPEEQPWHEVILTSGFWMLETEVTQEMWQSVMGDNPSEFKDAKNPVESVSWDDCQEFCQKLSKIMGQKVKLPTEAQWEYACRAGNKDGIYHTYKLEDVAWFSKNSDPMHHRVRTTKDGNSWGLYDMLGNVSEWCSDWYDGEYYSKTPTYDPENTIESNYRVIRGGSSVSDAVFCREAYRSKRKPDTRQCTIGFRIILVPEQPNRETALLP